MLNARGLEAYCPIKTQIKSWSDRKKVVEVPLFNSYLFVNLSNIERNDVFSVAGVVRFVYWCGQPAVVKDQEILEIKRWLNDFEHSNLEVNYFKAEQKVKILSGSFINQEAKILKQQGNHLVLTLDGLGLILRVKLSDTLFEKVG